MEIKISLKMPPAPTEEKPKPKDLPIDLFIEKVYDYLYKCNSSILDSSREQRYLKAVYKKLTEKQKVSPKLKPMLKQLESFISKQAQLGEAELDSANMHKWE